MSTPAIHQIDLTDPPGDGLVYAEILTEAGIIRVNVNLTKTQPPYERVVAVEIEPNIAGIGRIKTKPDGHWVTGIQDRGIRTDVTLTRKEGT